MSPRKPKLPPAPLPPPLGSPTIVTWGKSAKALRNPSLAERTRVGEYDNRLVVEEIVFAGTAYDNRLWDRRDRSGRG